MRRGDVVLVRFPHPSGGHSKKRPAVMVQSNAYLKVVGTLVVAKVTINLTMWEDPACLFLDLTTPDGQTTGLTRDCVASCLILVTIYADTIAEVMGSLSPVLVRQLDRCLKVALAVDEGT